MEQELVQWLRERLPKRSQTRIGIGDDAAVLEPVRSASVVTTDALMDGVDFELSVSGARRAGYKALAVNLSDLAAMAARPRAAVVSLVLPRSGGRSIARELYEGLIPLADRYEMDIVGGDTNSWDGALVVSITAIGDVVAPGPWRRAAGRPGDAILVTGTIGGSILGRHLDFQPRVAEALTLVGAYQVHAATDISDGLSWDLQRLVVESGCGAVLDLDSIPIDEAARRLAEQPDDEQTALDHALGDGEDFELILTVPAEDAARLLRDQPLPIPLTRIGQLVDEPGLWTESETGAERRPLLARGYQHEFTE